MSGQDFTELISVAGFLAALYFAGFLFELFHLPPMLGHLGAGLLLGPELAAFLPHSTEEFLELAGIFGVTLMIFESGMHIHYTALKKVAVRSLGVATLGTALPIGSGLLFVFIAYGSSQESHISNTTALIGVPDCNADGSGSGCPADTTSSVYPDGLALGCALAPTSVGIALELLAEERKLDTLFGQTIITTAFIDDIFSIVALIVLLNLAKGSISPQVVILPFVFSFAFLGVGTLIAFKVSPWLMSKFYEHAPFPPHPKKSKRFHHWQYVQHAHFCIMLALLCVYSYIGSLIGSHLIGAFVAGMSFSTVPRSREVWVYQTKGITQWLVRVFFGCTVAFSIPVSEMLTLESFYLGMICGIGPSLLTKVFSGLIAGQDLLHNMVIGAAGAGRGEFAFLVAETTRSTSFESGSKPYGRLMSAKVYSVCVWALLVSTIVAPFLFKYLLGRLSQRQREAAEAEKGGNHHHHHHHHHPHRAPPSIAPLDIAALLAGPQPFEINVRGQYETVLEDDVMELILAEEDDDEIAKEDAIGSTAGSDSGSDEGASTPRSARRRRTALGGSAATEARKAIKTFRDAGSAMADSLRITPSADGGAEPDNKEVCQAEFKEACEESAFQDAAFQLDERLMKGLLAVLSDEEKGVATPRASGGPSTPALPETWAQRGTLECESVLVINLVTKRSVHLMDVEISDGPHVRTCARHGPQPNCPHPRCPHPSCPPQYDQRPHPGCNHPNCPHPNCPPHRRHPNYADDPEAGHHFETCLRAVSTEPGHDTADGQPDSTQPF